MELQKNFEQKWAEMEKQIEGVNKKIDLIEFGVEGINQKIQVVNNKIEGFNKKTEGMRLEVANK